MLMLKSKFLPGNLYFATIYASIPEPKTPKNGIARTSNIELPIIPSIFIPLPKTVSRGDQIDNAKYFKKLGYCEMLFQEKLELNLLLEKLTYLEKNAKTIKQRLKNAYFIDGSQKIIDIILKEKG